MFVGARIMKPGLATPNADDAPPDGTFELSVEEALGDEEEEAPVDAQTAGAAEGTPLAEENVAALLARLPDLQEEADERTDFALREKSQAAPKKGTTALLPFPPSYNPGKPSTAVAATAGALEVVRCSPQGEVPVVGNVAITFSQPMVELGTVDDVAAQRVPMKITPQPEGSFRWLGTQTLLFEPVHRLCMATNYLVEVGPCSSSLGKRLPKVETFKFSTPPVTLKSHAVTTGPGERVIALSFDQKVDTKAVLANLEVSYSGNFAEVRLFSESDRMHFEREHDAFSKKCYAGTSFPSVASLMDGAESCVAVIVSKIPAGETVSVVLKKGTPCLEGPRTTEKDQLWTFKTHMPLTITQKTTSATSNQSISITFSNALDCEVLHPEGSEAPVTVTTEPAIEDFECFVSQPNMLCLRGQTKGGMSYAVTLHTTVVDIFGQHLQAQETFSVAILPLKPQLSAFWSGLYSLDPFAKPGEKNFSFNLMATNIKKLTFAVWHVDPAKDFPQSPFSHNRSKHVSQDRYSKRPSDHFKGGQLVRQWTQATECEANVAKLISLDLQQFLQHPKEGLGHLFVFCVVEDDLKDPVVPVLSWVQVTHLAVSCSSLGDLFVFCSKLSDGAPVADALVSSCDTRKSLEFSQVGKTDVSGCVSTSQAERAHLAVMAQHGNDVVIFNGVSIQMSSLASYVGHVISDRGIYKPKETVHAKGWVRRVVPEGPKQALRMTEGLIGSFVARDARGADFAKGKVTLNEHGAFDFSYTVPDTVNLGDACTQVIFKKNFSTATTLTLRVQVQEFRTPKFKASASLVSSAPKFTDSSFVCQVSASYFSGGALEGSPAEWTVDATKGSYSPPGLSEFTFSDSEHRTSWYYSAPSTKKLASATVSGLTNGDGGHKVAVACLGQCKIPCPVTVSMSARIEDQDQQSIGASCSTVVHPSALYVGLRTEGVSRAGDKVNAKVIVSDVEGSVIAGEEVRLELFMMVHKRRGPSWATEEILLSQSSMKSGEDKEGLPVAGLQMEEGGTYKLRAFVTDSKARSNQCCVDLYCTGVSRMPLGSRSSTPLKLITSKSSYSPGEKAEITVIAPFSPCEGFYVVSAAGVHHRERFSIGSEGFYTIYYPITDDHVPSINVGVSVDGASGDADHPFASNVSASKVVKVSRASRKLSVQLKPAKAIVGPGEDTSVAVTVLDPSGAAVEGAEVTLIVVDDAVLSLSDYTIQDPLDVFYNKIYVHPQCSSSSKRDIYVLKLTDVVLQSETANFSRKGAVRHCKRLGVGGAAFGGRGGGGGAYGGEALGGNFMMQCSSAPMARGMAFSASDAELAPVAEGPVIRERSNFDPLACFVPSLITDKNGKAVVEVEMPDNLTSYRIWAIASHGSDRFGFEEKSLTACLPVMIRPSLPRFFNFGDSAVAPVMLQNQSSGPVTVQIAVRGSNVRLDGPQGFAVTLAQGKRTKVYFNLKADEQVGTGRLQIAAVTHEGFTDSALVSFPIWTPATSEAFATYGELDGEGAVLQPLLPPSGVYKQFGGLSVTLSSTALQSLTDAFMYLYRYSFDCNEQLASSCMAMLTLGDILHAFKVPRTPSRADMETAISSTLAKLQQRQAADGSFGYWARHEAWPSPYVTIHIGWVLSKVLEKRTAGWKIELPSRLVPLLCAYLTVFAANVPSRFMHHSADLLSMAVFVLNALGKQGDALRHASKLFAAKKLDEFSLEALGRLLVVFGGATANGKTILAHLSNRVTETAETANFVTSYSTGTAAEEAKFLLLASSQRTDGVVLEALLRTDKGNTLIPKVVKGLLAHRKKGRWGNTQENCQALVALELYFRLFEATAPDFTARMWLGEEFVGQASYKGHSTESHKLLVPMATLVRDSASSTSGAPSQEITLQKSGAAGRLYFRLGLQYAPIDPRTDGLDCGFFVERFYAAIDDQDDVVATEGGYRIRSGARVRVKLTMTNSSRRYHVALVDKLPAGFEAVNPALKTSEALPAEDGPQEESTSAFCGVRCSCSRQWFDHQNLRDERVEAFASLLWEGVHRYSYVARATCKGAFVAPPATAEEMYSPEVFGSSPGLSVDVV